ncbi:MAG: hypothetical protein Q4F06_10285 [Eubacteriales bacterium]|nr:hypothetical protein [Eubacteriales bacterium]
MGLVQSAGYGVAQKLVSFIMLVPSSIMQSVSAFLIRIPVSIIMSRLPNTSLMLVGLATPITTVYGIIFFVICFAGLRKKAAKKH